MDTSLKKDDFCSYNQSAAPFYYTFMPYQYSNTYVYGEVGINAAGGSAGSYVRPDVVDIDSFLSGRDDVLSRCNPPVPDLDEIEQPPLVVQNNDNVSLLLSKFTKEKKSAVDLSAVDYNRWNPNIPTEPQDLRFVIEAFAASRGGMDTKNYSKLAWDPKISKGAAVNGDPNSCETILDPSFACGEYCNNVSGYSGWRGNAIATMPGKPQPNYPFDGITSQQLKAVGAIPCGEQQFYGPNYTEGSCGVSAPQQMFIHTDPVSQKMAYNPVGW